MQILRKTQEIIYPASSAHPTHFRLSETDQLRNAIPKLYFYKEGPASSEALKRSLSKTLTFFYPFAGRLVERTEEIASTWPDLVGGGDEGMECPAGGNAMGGTSEAKGGTCRVAVGGRMDVSCLDQGALFSEAWTDACLEAYEPHFHPHPDFALLLVPDHHDFLLRVQSNGSISWHWDLVGGGDEVMESKDTCPGGNAMGGTSEAKGGTCRVAVGGRMDVSCLDQGALFSEAWTDACLEAYEPHFQPHPDFALLLVPDHHDFLLRVQITHFACGGMCLCVQAHHCLVDGASSAHFMTCWVEITNGEDIPSKCPYMSHPPLEVMYRSAESNMDDYSTYYQPRPSNATQELSNKVFQFSSKFIESLKSETSDESHSYSSFECMAAYMWKSLTLARGIASSEEVCLYYPVNGRRKLEPPLPPSYFGNVVFRTHASVKVGDLVGEPLSHITRLLRGSTSKVTDTHIRSVIEWSTRQPLAMSSRRCLSPDIFVNPSTSFPLCNFNFGWGNPLCSRPPFTPFECIMLLPSSLGRGHMEVVVALDKEHMNKLESLISQRHVY